MTGDRLPEPTISAAAQPCGDAFPLNRHLTCVRVPGHAGRHVWVSDSDRATASSTVTWRDHAEECTCCYCAPEPAKVAP